MIQQILAKRRGGQPGNQNAKNNRGNKHARGTKGNRGGKGAPLYNRNAYKRLTLDTDLLKNFRNNPEALEWIQQNAPELSKIELPKENDFASNRFSKTTDNLADTGQEFRYGVFSAPEEEFLRQLTELEKEKI